MTQFAYVVDDEEAVRTSVRALLGTRPNLFVSGFASGTAFLDGIEDRENGVVILDVNMPGLSGLEVLKELLPHDHRFASIIITGQGDIGMAVQAMKTGAVDFLEKPYEPDALFRAVDSAFDSLKEAQTRAERAKEALARIEALSPRERSVLQLLIDGQPNKVMASNLGLSIRTVEVHRANVMSKLGVSSLSEVMRLAFSAGMVET